MEFSSESTVFTTLFNSLDNSQNAILQCLLTITNEYFAHDQTIAVFCNNSAQYIFCALLLQYVHLLTNWPIQIYTQIIPPKQETWHLHGNYILVWDSEDIYSIVDELREIPGWNTRAKFLVAFTKNVNMNETIEKMFSSFWHEKVADVLVISPSTNGNQSGELHPLLDLIGWFPYDISSHCGDVISPTFLDQWVIKGNGSGTYLNNNNLFPQKITGNFQGCTIKASTFNYGNMVRDPVINGSNINYKNGYEIRLFNVVLQHLNLTPFYLPPPPDNAMWGEMENGTWTGVMGDVIHRRSDVAFGGVMNDNLKFYKQAEATFPHTVTGVTWYVPCSKPISGWSSLSRVFQFPLWLAFFTVYLMTSFIIYYFTVLLPHNENTAYSRISVCLLNLWAIVLGVSASELSSR